MTAAPEQLPPCIGCGDLPPLGAQWQVEEHATRTGWKDVDPEAADLLASVQVKQQVKWTRCPDCIARAAGVDPTPPRPAVDDITHARAIIENLAAGYPRLAGNLMAIVARIEGALVKGQPMAEDWAVPVGELLRLVGDLAMDERFGKLGTIAEACVEQGYAAKAFAAVTSHGISARFGTTRVPPEALELVGIGPTADARLPPPAASMVVLDNAAPPAAVPVPGLVDVDPSQR